MCKILRRFVRSNNEINNNMKKVTVSNNTGLAVIGWNIYSGSTRIAKMDKRHFNCEIVGNLNEQEMAFVAQMANILERTITQA